MSTTKQRIKEWIKNATPEQHIRLLDAIADLSDERVMEMSDEELKAEYKSLGLDYKATAVSIRTFVKKILAENNTRRLEEENDR